MKTAVKPFKKCYKFTCSTWKEVELDFLAPSEDVFVDYIYAESAGKARFAAWRRLQDVMDLQIMDVRIRRAPARDLYLPDPHKLISELSEKQIANMKHAWGFDSREPGYRNRYNDPASASWDALVELGLAETSGERYTRSHFYHLTKAGIEVMQSILPSTVRL